MSVFHSPGCRITWASAPTRVKLADPLFLTFGLSLDTSLWYNSNNFAIDFEILAGQDKIADHWWTGFTPTQLPGRGSSGIWLQFGWSQARYATNGWGGALTFRPRVVFRRWGPGGVYQPGEFAVVEEEINFLVE